MTPTQPEPQEAPNFPPADMGNHLLLPGPAVLTTSPVSLEGLGQRLLVTIRTGSATLTVFLAAEDVEMWAKQLTRDEARMGGSKLVAAPGPLPRLASRCGS